MTPEEKVLATKTLNQAIGVANKFGPLIIQETDGDIPVTTMASSLLMAGFCVKADVPMFDAVNLLMSAYKQAKEDSEERSRETDQ